MFNFIILLTTICCNFFSLNLLAEEKKLTTEEIMNKEFESIKSEIHSLNEEWKQKIELSKQKAEENLDNSYVKELKSLEQLSVQSSIEQVRQQKLLKEIFEKHNFNSNDTEIDSLLNNANRNNF